MIQLNLDLHLLTSHFGVSTSRIGEYSSKSIEEVIELEKAQGNESISLLESAMKDPVKLIELLKLEDPENRYEIIKNLNQSDLEKLLPLLSQQDLLWGLKYFKTDVILEFMQQLPSEELQNIVFKHFTMKEVFMLMPNSEMNKLLENQNLERKDVMKHFESLDPKELERILTEQFGAIMKDKTQEQQLKFLEGMEDREFTKMLTEFNRNDKIDLLTNICKLDPKFIEEVNPSDMVKPMRTMEKAEIITSMQDLDPEFLIPMIQELPPELIQVVATQIDPEAFADILLEDFADILADISL